MPSTTTRAALPYPLGTDPISDGDDAIKNLASRLDGSTGAIASVPAAMATGQSNLTISASTSGTVAITFPAGRFSLIPIIVVGIQNNAPFTPYMVRPSATPTTTGFTAVVNIPASASGTVALGWVAVQMTNTAPGYG